jgi:hypothetical protein
MISRKEFDESIVAYKRSLYVTLATAAIGFVVWAALILACESQLLSIGSRLFGHDSRDLIRPVLLLPVIVAMFIASAWSHRPIKSDHRLTCSQCGKFLGSVPARMIVMASGNSPYRGTQILDKTA